MRSNINVRPTRRLVTTFPKKYAADQAPKEVLALIARLVPQLIEGDHPALAALRQQFQHSVVTQVEMTGHGFYADFEVAPGEPLTSPASLTGGSANIVLSGVEHGAGCVLFVRDGRLSTLEGYVYVGTWAEDSQVLAVDDVQPILPEEAV